MICGDEKTETWGTIPLSQGKYFIKVFLQDHGYYFPVFEDKNEKVLIATGEASFIKKIQVKGEFPASFNITKKRKIKNQKITPQKLDEITEWSAQKLKSMGYACPEIKAEANAKSEELTLNINSGDLSKIVHINEEKIEGLNEKSLRRYDAFEIGEKSNIKWINMTKDRVESSGIVESTYFVVDCQSDGVHLTQKTFPGRPRLIQAGVGVNTEEYGLAKASWQHGRLGQKGSKLKTSLYASYLRQQFDTELEWYIFKPESRFYLLPLLSFQRETDDNYNYISGDIRLTPAYRGDTKNFKYDIFLGPQLTFTRTFEGASEELTRFLTTLVEFKLESHNFEYFRGNPQKGYEVKLGAYFNSDSFLSDLSVQKFSLEFHKLWNVGNYSPPWLVLGLRGGFQTSLFDTNNDFNRLPPKFLYYLGGFEDLRGFDRDELPHNTRGALTSAFTSFEARFVEILPFKIQPLLFADAGVLGRKSFNFSREIYFSPGAGVRVDSPIGVFRSTIAHGFVLNEGPIKDDSLSHWQFYFSFGEEF